MQVAYCITFIFLINSHVLLSKTMISRFDSPIKQNLSELAEQITLPSNLSAVARLRVLWE
jgi:hypothetical protein